MLNAPVVPVIAPLLASAFTVAVPAVLNVAPYSEVLNAPVVPVIAPLLANDATAALPAVLNAVLADITPLTSTVLRGAAVAIPKLPAASMRARSLYTSEPTAPVNVAKVKPPLPMPLMLPPPVMLPTSSIPPPLVPTPAITTVALPPAGLVPVLCSTLPFCTRRMRSVYTSDPAAPA